MGVSGEVVKITASNREISSGSVVSTSFLIDFHAWRLCLPLVRLLYGHPKAAQIWEKHLHNSMLKDGWTPIENSNQCYYKDATVAGENVRWVFGAYVDDCVTGGKHNRQAWKSIRKLVDTTESEDISRLLAVIFTTSPESPTRTMLKQQMRDYCHRSVEKYLKLPGAKAISKVDTPMIKHSAEQWQDPKLQSPGRLGEHAASLLMTLLYPARMYRADIQFPVTFLARFITRWTVLCDMMVHRIFCYVHTTADYCLVCTVGSGPQEIDSLQSFGYPDADHGDCPMTNRSTSGNAVMLVGHQTKALTHWC